MNIVEEVLNFCKVYMFYFCHHAMRINDIKQVRLWKVVNFSNRIVQDTDYCFRLLERIDDL